MRSMLKRLTRLPLPMPSSWIRDILPWLTMLGIVGVAVLLCLSGDWIRRRTGGRIRHAEVHLLAWLPTLALEIALLFADFKTPVLFLFPLIFAAIVYLFALIERWNSSRSWARSEERLDALDAAERVERLRRERIESYKHGARPVPLRHGEAREQAMPVAPRPLPMALVPGAAMRANAVRAMRGEDSEGAAFRSLAGWRLKLVVFLQLVMICSVMFSLLFGLDNLLELSARIEPAFFWIAGSAAFVCAAVIAALTRTLAFLLPTIAMAVSLAAVIGIMRLRVAALHRGLFDYAIARVVGVGVTVGALTLLVWSVRALWPWPARRN
jgi:hypothetical protein